MKRLVFGICDDEEIFRSKLKQSLEMYIKDKGMGGAVITFTCGEELLAFGEELDILFLDEEMKQVSGTDVKNHLNTLRSKTAIIYVTSHGEIMRQAFGRNVYAFLTKPLDFKLFYTTLDSVIAQLDTSNDIIYIEAEVQYIRYFFVSGESLLEKNSLTNALEKQGNSNLVRCHRSWVVNLLYIDKIIDSYSQIIMHDGKKIPISRQRKNEFKHAYADLIDARMKIMLGE